MTRGRSVRIRNAGLTFSTYPASGEFWALNVGITSQIQAFWNLQASQACFHYSMKVTYVGSAMSDGWMLNEFPKTFCLVNLQLAPDALQGPSSGASIQLPEKHWPQIEASGEQLSRLPQAWRGAGERAVEGKEKRSHHNSEFLYLPAAPAIELEAQEFVCAATLGSETSKEACQLSFGDT